MKYRAPENLNLLIASISTDPRDYQLVSNNHDAWGVVWHNQGEQSENQLYMSGPLPNANIQIYNNGTRNNQIFLNQNIRGNLNLRLRGNGGIFYIGENASFNELTLRSRQDQDFIAIGDGVAVTGPGNWVSGLRCDKASPYIVVGDCCLLSSGVTIRNSDGHPIFDRDFNDEINTPRSGVSIEPHSWIGENVTLLKDVTIGAFSIVGTGAIVARSIPRYARAYGNPAQWRTTTDSIWAWDNTEAGIQRAKTFQTRFPP